AAATAAIGAAACTVRSGVVNCNFGTISVGATPSLNIIVNAGSTSLTNTAASGSLQNSAIVSSTSVVDPTPANNTSSPVPTSLIGEADINIVSISGTPDPVLVGNSVTYTVTINNIGTHPSQPLTFNNTWPTAV